MSIVGVMSELIEVLMNRDELSLEEATDRVREMRRSVLIDGEDPEEILYDEGLEPDYIFDILY